MRRTSVLLAVLIAPCLPGSLSSAEALQKVRIGFSTLAFSYMPFYVAQEKGLLKKVGLEAEYIQMRSSILPQAVINGNINFFPILSTGLSAAVSGQYMDVLSQDRPVPPDLDPQKFLDFSMLPASQ